ncbi:MAG: thioredoxin [Bacteroides sp.]|nr:thioredoxin [Bacteroides sp.]
MALEITNANFKEVLESGKPLVIDFWAPWCGPCKQLIPVIEELAEEFKDQAIIAKCNVDESDDVAAQFSVRNIPTVVFLKNGELVDKQVGVAAKSVFVEKIKNIL